VSDGRVKIGVIGAAIAVAHLAIASGAHAQGRRRPSQPAQHDEPKPSDDDTEETPTPRTEPDLGPPANPTARSKELDLQIGSDWSSGAAAPVGPLDHDLWFPYYEERRGDYRLRLMPPVFVEQTRGLRDPSQSLYGIPDTTDTQGLYGLIYYRRRSPKLDMDVVFPALWRVRDEDAHVTVVGPIVHREAPGEHDNWLAPLFFEGARRNGGYFHAPLLLTTSHSGIDGAFALAGPYFRSRTGTDVDLGVAPLFFHGDNGNVEGNRTTYTLIPPLLFYHRDREIDATSMTVVGPVIHQSDAKRDVFDVAPLFFHIQGRPETGGVVEQHTTLLPLFHYGYTKDTSLFIVPGYYRRVSPTTDTMLTPLYSRIYGRGGDTSLTAAGPIVPLWWDYRDRGLDVHAWALAPFIYDSQSPGGSDWLTPAVGRFERYGESTTWWIFPTVTLTSTAHGWEDDLHPLVYIGRSQDAEHTVVAPFFWDFAGTGGRTTIGFPLYWRFAEGPNDSVTQVAANTLYTQKRVPGGIDWQFHLLPLFSYGESPTGYFWNVLFGLAGYSRDSAHATVRALWIPFDVSGGGATQTATTR